MNQPRSIPRVSYNWYWRWAAVLADVVLALILRQIIAYRYPGLGPFITFFPAVLLAALIGGLWAGVASTVLSALLADYFIFPPAGSFTLSNPSSFINLAVFTAFGIFLSAMIERHRRNREKLAALQAEAAVTEERRKADEEREKLALVQSERKRLYEILETLPAMTCLLSPDHKVIFANRMFREKFGEANGRPCYEFCFGKSSPCEFCESFVPLKTGKPHRWEVNGPDGSVIEAYDQPFTDIDGSQLILEMDLDITEQRRAQAELQQHRNHLEELVRQRTSELAWARAEAERSAAQLQTIFNTVQEHLYVYDGEGNPIVANQAWRNIFSRADGSIMTISELDQEFQIFDLNGAPLPVEQWPISRVMRGEKVSNVEIKVKFRKTGQEQIISCSGTPVHDADGRVLMAVETAVDISAHKQAEASLSKAKREWEHTFDTIPDLIAILDNQHRIVRMNRAMAERLSMSSEASCGQNCFSCVHGGTEPPALCPHLLTIKDGREHTAELEEPRMGGFFLVTTTPLLDENGRMEGAVHVARDITARKRTEDELRKINRILKARTRSNQAILHAKDEAAFLQEVCDIIVEDYGHTMVWIGFAEHDEKRSIRKVAHAGFDEGYLESLVVTWGEDARGRGPAGMALRTGKPAICHDMLTDSAFEPWRKNAIKRGYASSVAVPFKVSDQDRGILSIYSQERGAYSEAEVELLTELARDVEFGIETQRIRAAHARAEEELLRSREMLGLFIDNAPAAMAMFDRNMRYLRASRRWKSECGLADRPLMGLSHYEVFPDIPEEWKEAHRRGLAGESLSSAGDRFERADGSEQWIRWELRPWYETDGSVGGILILTEDITERKKAEAALLESEKLALQREQLRALTERLEQAREEERTRVARDLHDDIGQLLTAVKMDLNWIGKRVTDRQKEVHERLDGAVQLINEGVRSVRKICSGLRPSVLDDLGLAAAIEWQANEFSSRTGVTCRLSLPEKKFGLPSDHASAFFRIFQECLTNVSRHAHAHSVDVSLFKKGEDLVLVVKDDGGGVQDAERTPSLGILGMKERAQGCGGELTIASSPGKGTTVTLRVPLRPGYSNEDDDAHSDRG